MSNPWLAHVKQVKNDNPGTPYKDIMALASKTYVKPEKTSSPKKTKPVIVKDNNDEDVVHRPMEDSDDSSIDKATTQKKPSAVKKTPVVKKPRRNKSKEERERLQMENEYLKMKQLLAKQGITI